MKPNLNAKLSSENFKNYYFRKEELVDFCRREGLKVSGNKQDLEERIILYLDTGEKIGKCIKQNRKKNNNDISLDSKIGENFICSQEVRSFFEENIGSQFKFKVKFQKWLKNNPEKTFAQAIIAYNEIENNSKKTKTKIDKQFKYNTYIRDFFNDNNDKTFKDAVTYWNYKKNLKGPCKYEKKDLLVLNNN